MRLPTPFIVWNRNGRSSMLLFLRKEMNGQRPFRKGKGARMPLLVPTWRVIGGYNGATACDDD
jgi:hypothetical protein